ncbi:MAG TPA: hypothetical protein VHO04_15640 [Sphingopyxis sp.]|uniref:hypothetical protein n=1 Tax=Sphingopyxis sp. TaxID=1908224 RepID=UPI002E30493E|nr:hypothetical protein [Sphingopyxis sp.]HEX2814110.1 hypothetical protein [Sphingopyxis sp.]
MRNFDFSSWQSIGATLLGLALFTLIGVGIRLVVMMTIQQRRERINRQINERLRTLIAAYKTLGGSFTGNLAVDPRHLRDLRRAGTEAGEPAVDPAGADSDRPRRIRDAVEAALSDIILLGTADQVRLASRAARELVEGRPVHVHDLVVALRDFIRAALDLDPVPSDSAIPLQGPTRPSSGGKGGGSGRSGGGGGEGGGGGGRGGGGGGGGMGGGMGMAGGLGVVGGASLAHGAAGGDDADDPAGLSKN